MECLSGEAISGPSVEQGHLVLSSIDVDHWLYEIIVFIFVPLRRLSCDYDRLFSQLTEPEVESRFFLRKAVDSVPCDVKRLVVS